MAGLPRLRLKVSSSQRSTNTSAWHLEAFPLWTTWKSRLPLETSLGYRPSGKRALRPWLFFPLSVSLFHFFLLCSVPRLSGCFMLCSGTTHRAPDEQGLFTLHIGWTPGLDFYPSCPKTAPKSKAKLLRRQIPLDIPDFTFLKTELENHSSKISKTEWSSYLDWCVKPSWSLKLPPCQLRF